MRAPAPTRSARRAGAALALVLALLGTACVGSTDPSGGDGGSGDVRSGADGASSGLVDVVEVIDGDTLDVRLGGEVERVRLVGINTPERGECLYDEAAARLTVLAGEQVALAADVSDRDQHGRLLRYVARPDGTSVNEQLVLEGLARSRAYPPDTSRQAVLDQAEVEAREAGRGLWAVGACGTPGASALGSEVAVVAGVADPPGSDEDDPNAETVTVANVGDVEVDLSGWVLKDTSASHRFRFPVGFVLQPGAEVVVHTGCGEDTATDLHWCRRGSLVWNNDGDTAYLEDPQGNTVSVLDL